MPSSTILYMTCSILCLFSFLLFANFFPYALVFLVFPKTILCFCSQEYTIVLKLDNLIIPSLIESKHWKSKSLSLLSKKDKHC